MAILGPLKYMYLQPDVKALFDKVKAIVLIKMDHLTKILVQRTCHKQIKRFLIYTTLTLNLLVLSTNNLCKQFGSRSGPTKHRSGLSWIQSDYTLMVYSLK